MPPDGYQDLTQSEVNRMCEENLEELRQMHIERNQSYQWRPVEYFCNPKLGGCGKVGFVEIPHTDYEIGVIYELPGFGVLAVFEDHAERFPECECPRLEYQKWK
jgi:hypothetical protein